MLTVGPASSFLHHGARVQGLVKSSTIFVGSSAWTCSSFHVLSSKSIPFLFTSTVPMDPSLPFFHLSPSLPSPHLIPSQFHCSSPNATGCLKMWSLPLVGVASVTAWIKNLLSSGWDHTTESQSAGTAKRKTLFSFDRTSDTSVSSSSSPSSLSSSSSFFSAPLTSSDVNRPPPTTPACHPTRNTLKPQYRYYRFLCPILVPVPASCRTYGPSAPYSWVPEFDIPPREYRREVNQYRPPVEEEPTISIVHPSKKASAVDFRLKGNSRSTNHGVQELSGSVTIEGNLSTPAATKDQKADDGNTESASSLTTTSGPSTDNNNNDGNDDDFPYSCPRNASVRIYRNEQQSRWSIVVACLSLVFYIGIWCFSALFPLYLAYWSVNQILDLYRYYSSSNSVIQSGPTPLLQFFRKLKNAIQDTALFVVQTCRVESPSAVCASVSSLTAFHPKNLLTRCVVQSKIAVNRIVDVVASLGWRDHFCLSYWTSAVLYNLSDWLLERPTRLPRYAQTHGEVTEGFLKKLQLKSTRWAFAWFLPGSAVIFEDYRAFVSCGRFSNPPSLLCYHPHGMVSFGMFFLLSLSELQGYKIMAAPALKVMCPLFRLFFDNGYTKLGSASRVAFAQAMKDEESMILVPGGIQEATITEYGKEKLYMKQRKGFIRRSLQHGYTLIPTYGFGETILYNHMFSGVLENVKLWLNAFGIVTVYPFGSLCWPIGVVPRRVPMLVVVGHPMSLPKIEKPTNDEVDFYHEKYCNELRRLYVTYADSYYRFCRTKYNIVMPKPTAKDTQNAIAVLSDAPPLQVL